MVKRLRIGGVRGGSWGSGMMATREGFVTTFFFRMRSCMGCRIGSIQESDGTPSTWTHYVLLWFREGVVRRCFSTLSSVSNSKPSESRSNLPTGHTDLGTPSWRSESPGWPSSGVNWLSTPYGLLMANVRIPHIVASSTTPLLLWVRHLILRNWNSFCFLQHHNIRCETKAFSNLAWTAG